MGIRLVGGALRVGGAYRRRGTRIGTLGGRHVYWGGIVMHTHTHTHTHTRTHTRTRTRTHTHTHTHTITQCAPVYTVGATYGMPLYGSAQNVRYSVSRSSHSSVCHSSSALMAWLSTSHVPCSGSRTDMTLSDMPLPTPSCQTLLSPSSASTPSMMSTALSKVGH